MSRSFTVITTIFLIFLAIAILGGMVWSNTLYARDNPGETDFLVPWLSARTYLQYGDNPYSQPTTQRNQIIYYGRLATENEDPLALWLPLPVELAYFPFAFIPDYNVARGIWMTLSEFALIALGFLSVRLTGWQPSRLTVLAVLLFSALSVFGMFGLMAGSGSVFAALSFVGFLLALRAEQDELAGALLLLPLFTPRLLGIFPIFIVLWIIYHRRWRVVGGIAMTLGVLMVLSFLVVPDWSLFISDWFLPYFSNLLTHNAYNPGLSTVGIFGSWSPVLGPRVGWLLAGVLSFVLFIEWNGTLRRDFRHFLWVTSLTVSVTPLLVIPVRLSGLVFLTIPLVFLMGSLGERWPQPKRLGVAGIFLLSIFGALWLLTIILALGWAYIALADILVLLIPIVLLVMLYWMRWWIVHPSRPGREGNE